MLSFWHTAMSPDNDNDDKSKSQIIVTVNLYSKRYVESYEVKDFAPFT